MLTLYSPRTPRFYGNAPVYRRRSNCKPRWSDGNFIPFVNVMTDEQNYYFEAELPGVSKDELSVKVNDENVLVIEGTKHMPEGWFNRESGEEEKSQTLYKRSFLLPDDADRDKTDAKLENGILYLKVGRIVPVKNEKIVQIH